jgi:hypothetical protein
MTIFAVYGSAEPPFAADQQDPAAVRYLVAGRYVDADAEPTAADVSLYLAGSGDVTAGNILKVSPGGALVTAVPGEDYVAPGASSSSGLDGGEF